MKEIDERLSTYIDRIERLEQQFADRSIIVSTDLEREYLIDGEDDDIRKEPILWRLYQHNMFYVVTVPPNKEITRHQHDEPIFRFIAKGSLVINNEYKVEAGMWCVVKANTPYAIYTEEGYISMAAYTSNCRTRRTATGKHLIEE